MSHTNDFLGIGYTNDVLVIVDMQNDFIDGVLGTKEAQAIVPKITNFLDYFDGRIILTQDTHFDRTYLSTQEGQKLPVKHCIVGTDGWKINEEILTKVAEYNREYEDYDIISKNTFGSLMLTNNSWLDEAKTIYVCGVCTDICVISNVMILKAAYPNTKIVVLKDLCAGTTAGNHANALVAMQHCQVDIEKAED